MLLGFMQKPPKTVINLEGSVKKAYYKKRTYKSIDNYKDSNIPQIRLRATDSSELSLTLNSESFSLYNNTNYIVHYRVYSTSTDYEEGTCYGSIQDNSIGIEDKSNCIKLTVNSNTNLTINIYRMAVYEVVITQVLTYTLSTKTVSKDNTLYTPFVKYNQTTLKNFIKEKEFKGIPLASHMMYYNYVNNKYITYFGSKLYYSEDLNSWTKITMPSSTTYIGYYYGLYIAMTEGGLYYSTDLNSWTQPDSLPNYNMGSSIKTVNGKLFISSTSWTYYSDNGIDWTQMSILIHFSNSNFVYWNNSYYYMTDTAVKTSTDLQTWTDTTVPLNRSGGNKFIYNNDILISYPATTVNNTGIQYTTDGITWKTVDTFTDQNISEIAFNNNTWVCTTPNIGAYKSTNGRYWSKLTIDWTVSDINLAPSKIIYKNNTWCIVLGYNQLRLVYSQDLLNWYGGNYLPSNITENNKSLILFDSYKNHSILITRYGLNIAYLSGSFEVQDVYTTATGLTNSFYYIAHLNSKIICGDTKAFYVLDLEHEPLLPGYKEV